MKPHILEELKKIKDPNRRCLVYGILQKTGECSKVKDLECYDSVELEFLTPTNSIIYVGIGSLRLDRGHFVTCDAKRCVVWHSDKDSFSELDKLLDYIKQNNIAP